MIILQFCSYFVVIFFEKKSNNLTTNCSSVHWNVHSSTRQLANLHPGFCSVCTFVCPSDHMLAYPSARICSWVNTQLSSSCALACHAAIFLPAAHPTSRIGLVGYSKKCGYRMLHGNSIELLNFCSYPMFRNSPINFLRTAVVNAMVHSHRPVQK